MAPTRPPWWLYLLAASFLSYYALITHTLFQGPEPSGLEIAFDGGGAEVREVAPGSPAARAGLLAGDRLVSVDGQVVRGAPDWTSVRANWEGGRPVHFEVKRAGRVLELKAIPGRRNWDRSDSLEILVRVIFAGAQLIALILALILAFRRAYDPVARVGAALLGGMGVIYFVPPYGLAAAWRSLPSLAGELLWIPFIDTLALPPLLLTFFALFPRPLFHARWIWIPVWLPAIVLSLPICLYNYRTLYTPDRMTGVLPDGSLFLLGLMELAYAVAALAALVLNYRRLESVNERRRVRVLVAGSLVGLLGILPMAFFMSSGRQSAGAAPVILSWPGQLLSGLLFLALPLSFTYAILRHRLFDVRLMVRQGLQYALARRFLVSAVPFLGALLAIDLLAHRHQALATVFHRRGWAYLTVATGLLTAHFQQRRWMDALDRRFFRERYDAHRVLREVIGEVREAGSLDRVAPRLVARVEAALHPEFAAILVRNPGGSAYQTLAVSPAGQAPPPLPAEGKLMALVRLLGKPVEASLSDAAWLKQQLPHEETDFLRRSRLGLLVPVATVPGAREAVLALGLKRSEEPYCGEDQELLTAIAASLAILLEKPSAPAPPSRDTFEECPRCGACYDSAGRCPQDGAALLRTPCPRNLAGRYRLDRRIGRGGMGTVYLAADTSLDRRVAAKLIREDLLGSTDAAERFRREAKVAASFTHPNVVTIHDYGVSSGSRAYLIMEYLEGRTLRDEIQARARLPAGQTVEVLRGVCAAVEAAHRRQLVHRDLKPENIFLAGSDSAERVKVLDFGVAKFLPSVTEQPTVETGGGVLVGTPRYMAPEQLRGEAPHPAWDLWALALVAYEMLTGAHPFSGASLAEWHQAIQAGRFAPIRSRLPEAPGRWEEFFRRALAPEPESRPASALAFAAELEAALI